MTLLLWQRPAASKESTHLKEGSSTGWLADFVKFLSNECFSWQGRDDGIEPFSEELKVLCLQSQCLPAAAKAERHGRKWYHRLHGSVQSLSHVWLFATPWTAALQASLSITNSQSLLKLMSIRSVMPFNPLILCHPLSPPAFSLSQHQGIFQWVSYSHLVAKVLELQLQHQSFQWIWRTGFL